MDRKNIRVVAIVLLVLVLSTNTRAQNLVPNPSFEEYTECPDGIFQIDRVVGWESLIAPVDYYHECGLNGQGIPVNRGGGGYARTGEAYVFVASWTSILQNGRRYLTTQLQEPLVPSISYYTEFHVSMADSLWYATRNLGIHFSAAQYSQDVNDLLALTPQVKYEGTGFLDDKIGWTRISGHFTAQGGEQYLAIGNFDPDSETDTLFVSGGGTEIVQPEEYWEESAYFVDDVLLIPDSIYLSNEELEIKNDELSLYPNPAADQLTVETEIFLDKTLELFDVSGRMASQHHLQAPKESVDVGGLPRGVYVVVLKDEGVLVERKKLILQ